MNYETDWTSYAKRAAGDGLRGPRNRLAAARKELILKLITEAGEQGICAEDLEIAIEYKRTGKGGGSVQRLIGTINEGLIYSRAEYRIGEIIKLGAHNRKKAFYRIVEAGRREVHFEKPLKP